MRSHFPMQPVHLYSSRRYRRSDWATPQHIRPALIAAASRPWQGSHRQIAQDPVVIATAYVV